jgi:hypothetical protein
MISPMAGILTGAASRVKVLDEDGTLNCGDEPATGDAVGHRQI